MAYNPPEKNLKNDDGHPNNDGDGKCCLKIGVYIYRELLKRGISKSSWQFFQLILVILDVLLDTSNISMTIYLEIAIFFEN